MYIKIIEEPELGLHPDNQLILKSKLAYLEDAAKRHGRIDWINLSIGVLVNIAIALALDPDKASLLWGLFKDTVGPSLGDLIGLPLN